MTAGVVRLLVVQARWDFLSAPEDAVDSLSRDISVSRLTARLLVQRGLTTPDSALAFLDPRLEHLLDPYLMADMDRVIARILKAIEGRERILIYGDYDVDGITAVVVLRRALEMIGCAAGFYLPKRLEEGYGLKPDVITQAAADGYRLIISVDSGIRAFDACRAAQEAGVDLIVTDHHLPDTSLPPAFAILNPRRPDCSYPDKNLAAVGVVFKVVQALFRKFGKEAVLEHFLKLVAIGTIADMVPLTGENRVMARLGLAGLGDARNVGLKALLEGAGVGPDVSMVDVGFRLAPRMNAVTRMGGGQEVIDLFSARDPREAEKTVRFMNEMNAARRREEETILSEIEKRIRRSPELAERSFLVFTGEGWHRGVIGIVASRLVERFHRPALVLSSDGDVCQGSGRSIPGLRLLDALDDSRELFVRYGGHAQAAGCTLLAAHCAALAERLDQYASRTLTPEQLLPSVRIDSTVDPDRLSLELARELDRLAPFGMGNPAPVFSSNDVAVIGGPWVLKEKHLKLQVKGNGGSLDVIWWKNAGIAEAISRGSRIDLAYSLTRESYQGKDALLLDVRDLRLSIAG
jgi:single-stranded-DNA-specific exonuclease